MGTFIYAPDSSIIIGTAQWGDIDVSDDIIGGDVQINSNRQHELNFTLENHRHKYDGVFMPNDRLVLKLKRTRWLPIMSGYLNRVPFATTWPGTVSFNASCTLKRPFYRLYDSGAIHTTDLFNSFSTADPDAQGDAGDGGLGDRAKKVLMEMADWPEDKIHIAQLPQEWWLSVSGLWEKIRPTLENSIVDVAQSGASVYGADVASLPPGVFVGGSTANPSLMGPQSMTAEELLAWFNDTATTTYAASVPADRMVALYISTGRAEGVRGDLAFIQACWETGYFKSTSDVKINNFAGIGHPSSASHGIAFGTAQDGVLAHIQLLKRAAMGNDAAVATFANKNMEVRWGGVVGPVLSQIAHSYAEDGSYFTKVTQFWESALQHAGRQQNNGSTFSSSGSNTSTETAPSAPLPQGPPSPSGTGGMNTWVFPVPGGTFKDTSYNLSESTGIHPKGHAGTDISAPEGSPIYAATAGTVADAANDGGYHGGNGNFVKIQTTDQGYFMYLHMQTGSVRVKQGDSVAKGQQIGQVGSTGHSTGPHLHFEWHRDNVPGKAGSTNPTAGLHGADPNGGTAAAPLLTANADTYQYTDLSASLVGPRMLLNDQGSSVLALVESFITAGMREYCSAPNGDFIAWFPDYFGNYGTAAKLILEDIELTDFTIDWSDNGFVTHQFVVGSIGGYAAEVQPDEAVTKMLTTMGVATIEFPEILEAIIGPNEAEWMTADAIMERFGPRVDKQDYDAIVTPEAEFYMAVKLFMENWAKQFSAQVTIGFMPELWPGMILQIPSRGIQFYVEQVSHRWSYTSGFTTTVGICAPAGMNGKFADLPQAGALTEARGE